MLDAKQERPTEQWYEIISRSLIENTELQPLSKFKYTKASKILYPDAHSYPDFFAHNLVSPGRVIKHIRGKSALLKAFYYQFMKLAFEIEVLDRDYIEIFKSIIFHPNIRVEN